MSPRMILSAVAVWVTIVVALISLAVWMVPMTAGTGALALAIGLMPPAMVIRVRAVPA